MQQPPTHHENDLLAMFDAQVSYTAVDCPIEFGLHTCTSIGDLSGPAPCRDCAGLVLSGKFLFYKRILSQLHLDTLRPFTRTPSRFILLARLPSLIHIKSQSTQPLLCLHRPREVLERTPRGSMYLYRQNRSISIDCNDDTALMV